MTTNQTPARDTKTCDACWGNEECAKCGGTRQVPTALSAGYGRNSDQASEKQVAFAIKLTDELVARTATLCELDGKPMSEADIEGMSQAMHGAVAKSLSDGKRAASKMIDSLISSNNRAKAAISQKQAEQAELAKAQRVTERKAGERNAADVDGMYLLPDGRIVKVQYAVHGSGNAYAKLLTKLDFPKTRRGKEIGWDFEYVPGLVKECKPEHKMTLEQAKEWGALYGACCNCGATLTDEHSIEQGIGPICAKRFG